MQKLKIIFFGGLVGFLVILYDFDFLLNFGGPNTPISDFIIRLLYPDKFICCGEKFQMASLFLIGSGLLIGLAVVLIWLLFSRMKRYISSPKL